LREIQDIVITSTTVEVSLEEETPEIDKEEENEEQGEEETLESILGISPYI
jgi:hypothetical protein